GIKRDQPSDDFYNTFMVRMRAQGSTKSFHLEHQLKIRNYQSILRRKKIRQNTTSTKSSDDDDSTPDQKVEKEDKKYE